MPVEIIMPELGESVHEATVTKWLKQEGNFVHEDDPIVEIMTDKVNTELPAPATGTLSKIYIPEGGSVAVFAPLGMILEQGAAGETEIKTSPSVTSEPKQETPKISRAAETSPSPKWYTPVVRAMAKEGGLTDDDLSKILGSGEGGRVTKKDLEMYLEISPQKSTFVQPEVQQPKVPLAQLTPLQKEKQIFPKQDQEIVPLAGMRKAIAEAMVRNSQVPTVSTMIEVDVTSMVHFREHNKEDFQKDHGVKLTYTPFFIKALSEGLIEFPLMNAYLQQDGNILMNKAAHIGVAVALGAKGEDGLIVPVIRDCHQKGLIEIAKELESIALKARKNALGLTDIQGGTFTLTNPGTYGAFLGTPMINSPQAGILGTYTIRKIPVIIDDMIGIRSVMNLVLTYDHRLIDGMLAGKFLQSIKKKLEHFDFFQ